MVSLGWESLVEGWRRTIEPDFRIFNDFQKVRLLKLGIFDVVCFERPTLGNQEFIGVENHGILVWLGWKEKQSEYSKHDRHHTFQVLPCGSGEVLEGSSYLQ